jgi:hypothetical protein
MKVYYQNREEDGWIKGECTSMSGGKEIIFSSRDDQGRVVHEITLWNPEVLFYGHGFHVTGSVRQKEMGDNIYKLESVDVVTDKRFTGIKAK